MSNWHQHSTGLDNGLVLNRWQAIIWTNADPIHWHIHAALRGDELINRTDDDCYGYTHASTGFKNLTHIKLAMAIIFLKTGKPYKGILLAKSLSTAFFVITPEKYFTLQYLARTYQSFCTVLSICWIYFSNNWYQKQVKMKYLRCFIQFMYKANTWRVQE